MHGAASFLPALDWRSPEVEAALATLATADASQRGAVFTRREVVDFILDLVGYRPGADLAGKRLLEPSFGDGDFLLPAIERLLADARAGSDLSGCVRAVELNAETFAATRERVVALLVAHDRSARQAATLADAWLVRDDFLLTQCCGDGFDAIVGNPPYVRQELIPDSLLAAYRRTYVSLYDRADLYVPFIERGLGLLAAGGRLGFICSDRWMKNRYGGPLRRLVHAGGYRLAVHVDMVGTPAFRSEVSAYTAITVLTRPSAGATAAPAPTRVARRPEVSVASFARLAPALLGTPRASDGRVSTVSGIMQDDQPWLLDQADAVAVIRRLEQDLPTLEEAGCKVGIGVATGCDRAFIAPFAELEVEPTRKLPLAMARDLVGGRLEWTGSGVLNPFNDDGSLVDLARFPRFAARLRAHEAAIRGRHVAKRDAERWYRTIDRITPSLATTPKLLIPDIKGEADVALDPGRFYPHHNLYWITSTEWELPALQVVLRSLVARAFVSLYSVEMRGGFLRFQAQYLRRIRLPRWSDIDAATRRRLRDAAVTLAADAVDEAAARVYGLDADARRQLARPAD